MALEPATSQTLADYLAAGYWHEAGWLPSRWDLSLSNVITVDLTGLDEAGRRLARAALGMWEMVANFRFEEVAGDAMIGFDDTPGEGAHTPLFFADSRIHSATVMVPTDWLDAYGSWVGSYAYATYIHEIGHALGLGHAGPYDGAASFWTDARFDNDSWQQSAMSYFSQSENLGSGASHAFVASAMMADILAIQQLYGAPTSGATFGDTVYGLGSNLGNALDGLFRHQGGSLRWNALTIFDAEGLDTIDLSDDQSRQKVNLNGGTFSDVYGLWGNLGIAHGTVIENFVAGRASDSVIGNEAANRILGGAGNDNLRGMGGDDRLEGGGGNDRLTGGEGDDLLRGRGGRDAFVFESGADRVMGFGDDRDTLVLDDALWGGRRSAVRALDHAHRKGGGVMFEFEGGHTIRVEGVRDPEALRDDLAFV